MKCNTAFYGHCRMKDMHTNTLERYINLLYGYHLNCIVDNYLMQQYIPYHICPVVVICADR